MENLHKNTILICDDSEAVHEGLSCFLIEENMDIISAYSGTDALSEFEANDIDLVILDVMLPDMSGMDICRSIRKISDVPILFLSARGEEIDRILGLELGADDYVTKPFSPREVAIRVKRILERRGAKTGAEALSDEKAEDGKLRFLDLSVEPQILEVRAAGEKIEMTAREVRLMAYLTRNARRVLNREQILAAVWGYDYFGDTRAVDAAIKRIRKKFQSIPVQFEIQTVYGVGYRLQRKEEP